MITASKGHASEQAPHHLHVSLSTFATTGSRASSPLLTHEKDFVAAERAEFTDSMIFFGPWQAPDIVIPSITVSTGRSFIWISLKNESRPLGILNSEATVLSERGTIPVTRTIRSASIQISLFPVRMSFILTIVFPFSIVTTGGSSSYACIKISPYLSASPYSTSCLP